MTDVFSEITSAMQQVLREHQNGATLFDSLVKVANERNLSLEKAKRVTEGVNTLNMLELLKTGKDRTTEFEVVDSRDVAQKIIAMAKTAHTTKPISLDYVLEAEMKFVPFQDRLAMRKAAAEIEQVSLKDLYEKDLNHLTKKITLEISRLEKKAFDLHAEALSAENAMTSGLMKIATLLQTSGHPSLNQFGKEAEALYGESVVPYLHILGRLVPTKMHGDLSHVKVASVVDDSTQEHTLLKDEVLSKEAVVTQKLIESVKTACEAEELKTALKDLFTKQAGALEKIGGRYKNPKGDPVNPGPEPSYPPVIPVGNFPTVPGSWGKSEPPSPGKKPEEPPKKPKEPKEPREPKPSKEPKTREKDPRREELERRILERDLKEFRKNEPGRLENLLGVSAVSDLLGKATSQAGRISALGEELGKVAPGRDLPDLAKKNLSYYDRLKESYKLQTTIQQVLDSDPVLKHRNPETLLPIIQSITMVAPRLAQHPALLAATLRQASAGHLDALDPLTMEQYAKADYALQKNRMLQRSIDAHTDDKWRW